LHQQILTLAQNCKTCSAKSIKTIEDTVNLGLCSKCSITVIAYNRYYESNIPIEYWALRMPSSLDDLNNFKGPKRLVEIYLNSVSDLSKSYINGLSFCLAGTHGCGKTMAVTSILKKATHKNFTALYTTLGDIVSALTLAPNDEKFAARKELTEVDFLIIDELDPRFIGSESAADLFGRTFEHILRTRLQNKLPTIIVSNSPNPVESFSGSIKQSLESLMTKLPLVPILGKDVRKELALLANPDAK
jgi:DNA replication protein DnaC